MDRRFSIFILLCSVAYCQGIEMTMDKGSDLTTTCGILKCSHTVNQHLKTAHDQPQDPQTFTTPSTRKDDPKPAMSSITSMTLFASYVDNSDRSKIDHSEEIATITTTSPNISRALTNGRYVEGQLEPGQAEIQLEMTRPEDCARDYFCEVRRVGSQGKGQEVLGFAWFDDQVKLDRNSSSDSHSDSDSTQLVPLIQQLVSGLAYKIEVQFSQLTKYVNDKIYFLENRLEDRIRSTYDGSMTGKFNELEAKIDNYRSEELRILGQINNRIVTGLKELKNETPHQSVGTKGASWRQSAVDIRQALGNFSHVAQQSLKESTRVLNSIEREFETFRNTNGADSASLSNHPLATRDTTVTPSPKLTCACLPNGTSDASNVRASFCYRNMSLDMTPNSPTYVTVLDPTLDRDILCDTQTDGGGWIVFQRRTYGDVEFYRNWEDYKVGFGKSPYDFWLGLQAVYNITSTGRYELRIELDDYYAQYAFFSIADEADGYRLRLGSHSGTLGERSYEHGLTRGNGYMFSTYDKDNDWDNYLNCAKRDRGAWWYGSCSKGANLNGMWGIKGDKGMVWHDKYTDYYAQTTAMKIRRL